MSATRLEIDILRQRLRHYAGARLLREYWVSTARNGPGEVMDSECTPRGRHMIAAKIGADMPAGSVFVGRRPTGEIHSPAYAATQPPGRDWILTRILWLGGLEPGLNQGGRVDSHARYIYLPGVRMRNRDIIELFDRVEVGDEVFLYVG